MIGNDTIFDVKNKIKLVLEKPLNIVKGPDFFMYTLQKNGSVQILNGVNMSYLSKDRALRSINRWISKGFKVQK